jgi:hypothetical protein
MSEIYYRSGDKRQSTVKGTAERENRGLFKDVYGHAKEITAVETRLKQ